MGGMRRLAIAVLALCLAGCGGGSDEPERDEAAYITALRDVAQLDPVSDETLIKTGDAACRLSREAEDEDEYLDTLFAAIGPETDEMIAVYALESGAALRHLCPDQAERWGN